MKKMKLSYRLQIIKEVAQRHQLLESGDPMATHISHLLNQSKPEKAPPMFNGNHYDEHAGGWVSNMWDLNK
ncbi:TPA: hypothetical protein ACK210_001735 [Photobacterium damselae subsp. damselae]